MAATTTAMATPAAVQERVSCAGISLCHFTTAHSQLKSRSFHRECLPLAASGVAVRYISPASLVGVQEGVDFVRHADQRGRLGGFFSAPALLKELLRQDASLYHFQDPQLLPVAFALKLLFRKHIVYDAYEDFPSMAAIKSSVPRFLRSAFARTVDMAEHLAAHCFDGLITADPLTLRRLARAGKSRKLVFYNFPNLDFFPPPRPRPRNFDLVYRGGISERTGIFVLLEAMRLLGSRPSPVRLLLLGYFDGPAAENEIRDSIHKMGLASHIEICGRIEHESMAQALSQARIGICPLQPTRKFKLNIPVKVFEYWACGLPVVTSDLPPIRPFFRNAHAGLLFRPGDAMELARSIAWLLDHPDAAARMGAHGRTAVVERFNNQNEVRKLRAFCLRIADTKFGHTLLQEDQG
jgi:glycosyltransferase involved in cell wall biosynthesis